MSHVDTIKLHVMDLPALGQTAKVLGLELVEQPRYKWYGKHVGDYPLPEGFTREDLGKCKYALRIPGNPNAYEVGVVPRKDGQPGYELLWDFYCGGYGLEAAIGENGSKLKQEYNLRVGMKAMAKKGFKVERRVNPVTKKPQMRAWRSV